MRSYASAYKMCVATFPKPSQPDGSIAPCRPTRSPATGSVGMADVIAFCPRGGVSSYNRLLLRSAIPSAKQIAFWAKILVPTSRVLDSWSAIALAKPFSPGGQ